MKGDEIREALSRFQCASCKKIFDGVSIYQENGDELCFDCFHIWSGETIDHTGKFNKKIEENVNGK